MSFLVSKVYSATRFEDLGLTQPLVGPLFALLCFPLFFALHLSCLLCCVGLLEGREIMVAGLRTVLPGIQFYPVFAPSLEYDIQM